MPPHLRHLSPQLLQSSRLTSNRVTLCSRLHVLHAHQHACCHEGGGGQQQQQDATSSIAAARRGWLPMLPPGPTALPAAAQLQLAPPPQGHRRVHEEVILLLVRQNGRGRRLGRGAGLLGGAAAAAGGRILGDAVQRCRARRASARLPGDEWRQNCFRFADQGCRGRRWGWWHRVLQLQRVLLERMPTDSWFGLRRRDQLCLLSSPALPAASAAHGGNRLAAHATQ
jgi:hypothetical protein